MSRTGDRLAIAGADRGYRCPECGRTGTLASAEELRRLADEQSE